MHVVTASEMYQIDRFAIESLGMPGVLLMENAGRAVVDRLVKQIKANSRIAVLIGTGNNGGDGFVIARQLLSYGYDVDAFLLPPKEKVRGDALSHMSIFENAGGKLQRLEVLHKLCEYDCIVDSMLGIGVEGNVRSPYREVIEFCNSLNCLRVSVDIPSGLSADGTQVGETIFKADVTFTLQAPKYSAFLYPHSEYYGELQVVDIGIPPIAFKQINCELWKDDNVKKTRMKRHPNSHKGTFGRGMVIGGSKNMTGAVVLAAKAALRSGAGLLTVAIPNCIHQIVASQIIESTFSPWDCENGFFKGEIQENLFQFDGIAVGPGLGRELHLSNLIDDLISHFEGPLVLDADALYHLVKIQERLKARKAPTILTPHMGEFSRLTGIPVKEIEANRFVIAKEFAMEYNIFLVLKGPFTITTTPDGKQFVNSTGNPALAKGGSGDVLTGMILAFIIQGGNLQAAISNAIYFHGKAADLLVQNDHFEMDVLASDLIEALPKTFRTVYL